MVHEESPGLAGILNDCRSKSAALVQDCHATVGDVIFSNDQQGGDLVGQQGYPACLLVGKKMIQILVILDDGREIACRLIHHADFLWIHAQLVAQELHGLAAKESPYQQGDQSQ